MQIEFNDIEMIAEGAAFLGSGGGGDPYNGSLMCKQALKRYGAPPVITLDELDDRAGVYVAAMMGAPSVMMEKLIGFHELDMAMQALEKYTGQGVDAILPAEMGGMNSMLPLAVAAERQLPLLDADGMGRAFPELQMVTFNVSGVNASPMAMANEHGEIVLIDARDSRETELKARQMIMQMGGQAAISLYPMTGRIAKKVAIANTLSLAHGIGQALKQGRRFAEPFTSLLSYLAETEYYRHAAVLFSGKITDLKRVIEGGFTRGFCRISGHDGQQEMIEIQFQNENLVAIQNGQIVAIVPDLICILDAETAKPITTENLKYGQRVSVIGTSVPIELRSPEALEVFGPRAFGLEEDYVSIEDLMEKMHGKQTEDIA